MKEKRMARRWRLYQPVAVLGAAVLVLSACGDGADDTAATDTSSATGSATSSAPAAAPPAGTGQQNGELVLGTLLPQTGSLAYLGPPEFAGVDLAVADI